MPKHLITAPVEEFTGVVAGVHFRDGQAETDNENAVSYFKRQGYEVEPVKTAAKKAAAKPPAKQTEGDEKKPADETPKE